MRRRQQEAAAFETEREGLEAQLAELQAQLDGLRAEREALQQAAAEASAALAGLEERRRNAAANFEQTRRMADAQGARIAQIEQQMEAAGEEKAQARAGDRRSWRRSMACWRRRGRPRWRKGLA